LRPKYRRLIDRPTMAVAASSGGAQQANDTLPTAVILRAATSWSRIGNWRCRPVGTGLDRTDGDGDTADDRVVFVLGNVVANRRLHRESPPFRAEMPVRVRLPRSLRGGRRAIDPSGERRSSGARLRGARVRRSGFGRTAGVQRRSFH
jgi:hypothetical protein